MPGNCQCPVCVRLLAEHDAIVQQYEENTPLPDRFLRVNNLTRAALEYVQYLQRSIDHHNGRQEHQDGPQDGLENVEQQQQQQQTQHHAQLQPPQAQVVPGAVPVMANHQLLHATENAVVDGNAHAAENAQCPGNPYNMPPQLSYQHHYHHHAPAVGQLPLGHAAPGPALAAPPPPPTPAQLAPVTSQAAEQVRGNNQWRGQPPQGPPPGPAVAPKTVPTGTFIRALVAPGAPRAHYMSRCTQCIKQQDVCTAHYVWPCTKCKSSTCCSFDRPTSFVPVRIDPDGYNLGKGFTVREVGGRLDAPPHELLKQLKKQQKDDPAY
ncbi:hypothetical protein BKA80DRAFT_335943 [Phyllosticta citrichinensis]